MEIEIVKATEEHAKDLAPRLRRDDKWEVMCSSGLNSLDALTQSVHFSTMAWTALLDGVPEIMWGAATFPPNPSMGIVWLLSSEELYRIPGRFMKETAIYLSKMLEVFDTLFNYVHIGNIKSIKWLEANNFQAVETIEKMGPSDAQIEVERIEDVRGSKREYIIERAKKLMVSIHGKTDSREISKTIKESARTAAITEYGDEKLPAGDLSGKELIVVEGRADVLNLLRAGVNNVISMNGTKLPDAIKELSQEKDITLFVDGDRGGKLIA
ncbi:hypothetical protein LCGC14_3109710, partial [marine sediment metagenome]